MTLTLKMGVTMETLQLCGQAHTWSRNSLLSLSSGSRNPASLLPSCVPHLDKHSPDLLGVPTPQSAFPKLPPEGACEQSLSPTPPLPTAPQRLPPPWGQGSHSLLAEAVEFKPHPVLPASPRLPLQLHTSLYFVLCSPKPKPL